MVKRRRSNVATETSDSKNATKNPKNRSPTSLVEGERDQQQQDDHEQSVDGEEEEEEEVGKEEKGKEDIPQKKDSPDKGEDGDVELIGKRKRKRTRTRKKKGAAEDDDGEAVGGGIEDGGGGEGGEGGVPARVTDTVYVEGIPWTCDESDVREFFKGCGKIAGVRLPRWQDSGRPRGYGHVAFASTSGARAAFGLDGQYLKGRYLTVQAPQEPATEKARRVNRTAEQPRGCRTVFVKNLPYDVDEDAVQEAISGCGRVASVRLAMWNHTRKLKGFGYVEFATERGAETCVRTQEKLSISGRPIVVDFETGAPKGSFRRQDGAQIKKTSADAGLGKGKAPKFKVHT